MEPGTRHPGAENPCFWPPALCSSLASALARLSGAPGSAAEAVVREPGEGDGRGPKRPFPEGLDFTVCRRREALPDGRSSPAQPWAIPRSAQELPRLRRLGQRKRASSLSEFGRAYLSAPHRRWVPAARRYQWPGQCNARRLCGEFRLLVVSLPECPRMHLVDRVRAGHARARHDAALVGQAERGHFL